MKQYTKTIAGVVLSALALALPCGVAFAQTSHADLIEERLRISAVLDSLELEKQAQKRRGESITELETQSRTLRERASELRRQITELAESGELVEDAPETGSKPIIGGKTGKFAPKNTFDWIIIGVGAIAVIAAIVLVFGLIGAIFGRKKRAKPKVTNVGPTVSRTPMPREPVHTTNDLQDDADIIDSEGIRAIRQRMTEGIEQIQRFNPSSPSPFSNAAPREDVVADATAAPGPAPTPGPASENASNSDDADVLRGRIIQAARQGLGVQEISRRFQVSVDQVALVLRVAQSDASQGGPS